jgi:hypothetical protein
MSLKYTGKETEQPEYKILDAGDYNFVVDDAEERNSKSGNAMIALKLKVGEAPNDRNVYDYLVFDGKSEWKLGTFLHSIGRHPGVGVEMEIDPNDLVGRSGRAKIKVDLYNGNKSNKVQDYLFDKNAKQKPVEATSGADTIPF